MSGVPPIRGEPRFLPHPLAPVAAPCKLGGILIPGLGYDTHGLLDVFDLLILGYGCVRDAFAS